ncbi:ATP-binding protein [Streptomyces sp. CBMA29]|uniref:ATP-binding protein n=1 Tax=Streptomyces sp. CBMA29 TaxID=1896314 RepID=UPI001662041A|nr:ATP-binding protein [Streptomyces sp. CBMA29]MBD0734080.1 hypothetical protein [Streptomyces sp. CBMA29]
MTDDTAQTGFLWIGTGLPRRTHGLVLDVLREDDRAPDALDAVASWLHGLAAQQRVDQAHIPVFPGEFGRGLLLTGMPGTGKTTAAAAAACEVRRSGKSVYFTRWADHVDRARDLHSRLLRDANPEEVSAAMRAVQRVQEAFLAVLDDVGQERVTDTGFGVELLESTLRGRYDAGKPTIVTSNLSSARWTSRYSSPLRSFITQACRIVVFDGPVLRAV